MPIECFRALWNPSLTECLSPFPTDSYQKRPAILLQEDDASKNSFRAPGDDMAAEAEVYEILKQHPHPNICVYHGSVREGGYLVAICLKKYPRSLYDTVRSGVSLQRDAVLDGILEGLLFLHTLGFAHNDINPSNIMLDDKGTPVIVDFDSCIRIGQEVGSRKGGTFGWERKRPSISVAGNDFYGLSLIAQYMDGKVKNGLPLPPDTPICEGHRFSAADQGTNGSDRA